MINKSLPPCRVNLNIISDSNKYTMQSIPYEIVYMIYDYLLRPADVINLALTCRYLRHNISKEHLRVLSIRKNTRALIRRSGT